MISKQDRVKPRTVEDLERKYNFEAQFSRQQSKGEDGLTPFIGANGNWWIGSQDTGVKAGGSVSYTAEATEGNLIGTITIDGVKTELYAPTSDEFGDKYATQRELAVKRDEVSGEYYLNVGLTTITETQLQQLLALLQ